jgi:hypothetical protein
MVTFLFFWAIFALLDPDPDCESRYGYGSRDPIESGYGPTTMLLAVTLNRIKLTLVLLIITTVVDYHTVSMCPCRLKKKSLLKRPDLVKILSTNLLTCGGKFGRISPGYGDE